MQPEPLPEPGEADDSPSAREKGLPAPDSVPERWWGRPVAETRAWLELGRLLVDPVFHRSDGLPRGDGRPVILLPGFLAGDQTLEVLRTWLRRMGYRPSTCGFLTNTDCSDRALDRVERRVDELWSAHGRRVALIGHSRGGHFVRALAARRPDRVSHAISMGADLQGMFGATLRRCSQSAPCGRRRRSGRARSVDCLTARCDCRFNYDFARPFPVEEVRLTSIYSNGDDVVPWRGSVIPEAECVEVTGSHVGLIFIARSTARSPVRSRCPSSRRRGRRCTD